MNSARLKSKELLVKGFFKRKLLLPTILLSLASYMVVQMTPLLIQNTSATQPTTWQLAIIGTGIILLSALFLGYTAKLIGLTRGWLLLGVLFSSLMVITKFILIPEALYSQVFTLSAGGFDPNNPEGYFFIGLLLFVMYAVIFLIAYRHYNKKVIAALTGKKKVVGSGVYVGAGTMAMLLILGIIILTASGAGGILLFPMFFLGEPIGYINHAVAGGGVVLVLTTIATIVLSVKYLEHASNKAIETKNATILATTFWIGLSLILVYHILWVIFMGILLALWPFKTISPSGK